MSGWIALIDANYFLGGAQWVDSVYDLPRMLLSFAQNS